jgi:hypothetical protein
LKKFRSIPRTGDAAFLEGEVRVEDGGQPVD